MLPTVGAQSRRLGARMRADGYSTLEELEAHYTGGDQPMSPLNYVWYQYRWLRLAAKISSGPACLSPVRQLMTAGSTVSDDTVSGAAAGVILVAPQGLGVPTKPALDPFGFLRHARKKYRVPGRQWFSPLAYFQGPFDDEAGLNGSVQFFRRDSAYGNPPQIYLIATESGLGIIPTQTFIVAWTRGRQPVLWTPYSKIQRIELLPASRSRLSIVYPTTSSQLGEVIITTKDGRTARLTGTTVGELSEFLVSLGARFDTG